MAKSGGSSTAAGVHFEAWFVAYKFADAFFNDDLTVTPQPNTFLNHKSNKVETPIIDDVLTNSHKGQDFFNLKFQAPGGKEWSFSKLKNAGVLEDLKNQFLMSPESNLFLVSQSSCPIIAETLSRGAQCNTREELKLALKENDRLGEWDKLKEELQFTDEKMHSFSRKVDFQPIISVKALEKNILRSFQDKVTNYKSVPNSLYQLAMTAEIHGKEISRKAIIQHLENDDIQIKSHVEPKNIKKIFCDISSSMEIVEKYFFDNCHIERKEVVSILDFIKKPLDEKSSNIMMITGEAGTGKSVIIQDVLYKLQGNKIPVIAIKTDSYQFSSINKLSEEFQLSAGIKESIASVIETYGKSVILFDQIDALSQTLSKDRRVISVYINLIYQLSKMKELRIIISCRIFDLMIDPDLNNLKNKQSIEVQYLNFDDVQHVLKELGADCKLMSTILLDLLKIPLHLRIFCQIYHIELELESISSLQDLYDELWEQKILTHSDSKVKPLIEIARGIKNAPFTHLAPPNAKPIPSGQVF